MVGDVLVDSHYSGGKTVTYIGFMQKVLFWVLFVLSGITDWFQQSSHYTYTYIRSPGSVLAWNYYNPSCVAGYFLLLQ